MLHEKLLRLVYDPNAVRLEGLERSFNPFRVLAIERYEIRHVNTLAWLLDPEESHGLGDRFLRLFLAAVCQKAGSQAVLSAVAKDGLGSVQVQREVSTKDLRNLVDAEVDAALKGLGTEAPVKAKPGALDLVLEGEGWIVGVEAKVHAGAGDGQLRMYGDALRSEASNRPVCLVFLTKEQDGSSGEADWTQIGWAEAVVNPLRIVMEGIDPGLANSPQMGFIRSFLHVVEEQVSAPESKRELLLSTLVKDHEAVLDALKWREAGNLAAEDKAIIRQHSHLLTQLLQRFVPLNERRFPLLRQMIADMDFFVETVSTIAYVRFVPRSWQSVPWMFERGRGGRSSVECELENSRDQGVRLKLMITDLRPNDKGRDQFLTQRRSLLDTIQSDQNLAVLFPGAFKKNGEKKKPDDQYFGIRLSGFVPAESVSELLQSTMPAILRLSELIRTVGGSSSEPQEVKSVGV